MKLTFIFSNDNTIESEFILQNAKITQNYYSDLRHVDDSATFLIPWNEELHDAIIADINNDIKCELSDNDVKIFTGYLRKNATFNKTQRNQPFSIEVVSPSFFFDVKYSGQVMQYQNKTLGELVGILLSYTSFSGTIDTSVFGTERISIFILTEDDNIREQLEDLLYEFGYSYTFDGSGNLIITELFDEPPVQINQHFDGANCLVQIQQQIKERSYKNVEVKWSPIIQASDVLIFQDTTGADSNHEANIQIAPNSYYLDTQQNYLEYSSKYQGIKWISTADAEIQYADQSGITETFENLGTRGQLSIYNGTQVQKTITKLEVYGSGYFRSAININKSSDVPGTTKTVETKFIETTTQANNLCTRLANYYRYSNFTSLIRSKANYSIGSFVTISDEGLGTVKAKVVKRVFDIATGLFDYTLESITDYDPVETSTRIQNVQSNSDNGNVLRSALQDLSDRVDGIQTDTTACTADVTTATFKLDKDSKTISRAEITTTITLRHNSTDLEFNVGNITLPEGWSYTVNGRSITFSVGEGVILSTGQFNIPIQFRDVLTENYYVDKDGNRYIDKNGNPYVRRVYSTSFTQWNIPFTYFGTAESIYLHKIKSIQNIPANKNIGDYFVWSGANTATSLSNDGYFRTARTYIYIGTGKAWQWEEDTSHYDNNVVGDVLSIANADLEHNNSTVYQYLDHLTANTIFADMITANVAFITNIAAKLIETNTVVTKGALEGGDIDLSVYNFADTNDVESLASALAVQSTGLINVINGVTPVDIKNALVNGTTFISGGYIRTSLIQTSAIAISDLSGWNATASLIASKETPNGAQNKADNAQTTAQSNLATKLGYNSYADLVTKASQGKTIISGGYINTELIEVESLKAIEGLFEDIEVTGRVIAYGGLYQQSFATNRLNFKAFLDYIKTMIGEEDNYITGNVTSTGVLCIWDELYNIKFKIVLSSILLLHSDNVRGSAFVGFDTISNNPIIIAFNNQFAYCSTGAVVADITDPSQVIAQGDLIQGSNNYFYQLICTL